MEEQLARGPMDLPFLMLVLLLVGIGLIMVFSASYASAYYDAKVGNNPLVLALPHGDSPLLLDIAMSFASYGKLELLMKQGRQLPFEGGYNSEGNLTKDPGKIFESRQTVPIGYWKGSGLSILLDLIAATLSGGNCTREVGKEPAEIQLSQVFLAIDTSSLPDREALFDMVQATLEDLSDTPRRVPDEPVR